MAQVCSHCLGVPLERIHINETNTNTIPNAPLSGGSTGTDIQGIAVKVSLLYYLSLQITKLLSNYH